MYCRNCGSEMNQNAVVCVKCGVSTGTGNAYCPHCGKETAPIAAVCLSCGCSLTNTKGVYLGFFWAVWEYTIFTSETPKKALST